MNTDFNLINFLNSAGLIYILVIIALAIIVKIGTTPKVSKK